MHAVSYLKQERTHGVPGKDGGAEAVGMGFVAGRTKKCQRERERGGGGKAACMPAMLGHTSLPACKKWRPQHLNVGNVGH